MASNYVQHGNTLTFVESAIVHPSHSDGFVDSGDVCVIGRFAGVARIGAAASTDTISVALTGVWLVPVVGSGNGVSVGETVFVDPSAATLSPDLTDVPFGTAMETVSAGATTTIKVRLFGATPGALGAGS